MAALNWKLFLSHYPNGKGKALKFQIYVIQRLFDKYLKAESQSNLEFLAKLLQSKSYI